MAVAFAATHPSATNSPSGSARAAARGETPRHTRMTAGHSPLAASAGACPTGGYVSHSRGPAPRSVRGICMYRIGPEFGVAPLPTGAPRRPAQRGCRSRAPMLRRHSDRVAVHAGNRRDRRHCLRFVPRQSPMGIVRVAQRFWETRSGVAYVHSGSEPAATPVSLSSMGLMDCWIRPRTPGQRS